MQFMTLDEEVHYYRPEGYAVLNNSGGNKLRRYMIRKAWRWLHNCGALTPYAAPVRTYSFGPAEEKEILDAVREQIHRMLYRGHRIEDYSIICGAAKFQEITGALMHDYTTFRMSEILYEGGGYRGALYNLPVHVVPMMDGISIVPKVAIENPGIA